MARSIEVQVTAVVQLTDGDDPTVTAEDTLAALRRGAETTFARVDLNTLTVREGRKVLQRLWFKRRK